MSNHCAAGGMNRMLAGAAVVLLSSATSAKAQPGWVQSHQKISNTEGGFTVADLPVRAWRDDDEGGRPPKQTLNPRLPFQGAQNNVRKT